MAKLKLPFALCFSSFLLFFTLVLSSSVFSPIDHYLINCGSHGSTVDLDHRRFVGDSNSPLLSSSGGESLAVSNPLPGSSPIYHTGRVFTRPSKYVFSIRDPGAHLVRLHFQVLNTGLDYSNAQFYVLANGYLLLDSSSIEKTWNSGVIKEYIIRVDSDKLVITFVPVKKSKFAFVNAIEVISAPKDLVADLAQYVSSEKNEQISGLLKNGFETVHRVSVGGPKVTPFNDSLWRTWLPDDEFLKSHDDSLSKVYYSGHIQYQNGGASREVGPDNMYNTARIIKSSSDSIPNVNMSWAFPVDEGYKYLVRMHFCDIASVARGMLYFNVYVNGYMAYENLDLTMITGILASPFYADFVVDEGLSGVLTVSVGPSNMSETRAVDAILNGVEIMKINNSVGSFDGEFCAHSVLKTWRTGNGGVVLFLLAAVFLLLTATMLIKRRSSEIGDSIVWSRLPMEIPDAISKRYNQLSSSKV
nr:probable receptor-like protein kinase At5g24010 [Ipomoea batatas]